MKRIVVFLCWMTLVLPGMAQNQIPDLDFFINFSAISNTTPAAANFFLDAGYYRIKRPFIPGIPTYTNRLEIYIPLPSTARGGWVMEMAADGSLTPVAELTDPRDPVAWRRCHPESAASRGCHAFMSSGTGNYPWRFLARRHGSQRAIPPEVPAAGR